MDCKEWDGVRAGRYWRYLRAGRLEVQTERRVLKHPQQKATFVSHLKSFALALGLSGHPPNE